VSLGGRERIDAPALRAVGFEFCSSFCSAQKKNPGHSTGTWLDATGHDVSMATLERMAKALGVKVKVLLK
jgi:hypothetical protein